MGDWPWLALQATFAIIAIEQLRRRALPLVNSLQHPSLIVDVWGPLCLILPMIFFVTRIDSAGWSLHGVGWMVIGAPAACGLIALGVSMIVARRDPEADRERRPNQMSSGGVVTEAGASLFRLAASVAGAGVLLLLLGAAHDMTLWMGQCAFAIAAVLLWQNTPELASASRAGERQSRADIRAGVAMVIALACSIGQGVASQQVSSESMAISGAVVVTASAMTIAAAGGLAGAAAALRLGLWTAALGVFFGLGSISVARLVPEALHLVQGRESASLNRIATGFFAYIPEAFMLTATASATVALQGRRVNRLVLWRVGGMATLVFAAIFAAWRLASISEQL